MNVETKIIRAIATKVVENNYTISVFDGEEYPVKKSGNVEDIMSAVGATDETTFRIRNEGGETIGFIYFVHGNGEDVVSDWSDAPEIESIVRPIVGL